MSKYIAKTVILAKLEATPGTDPTPTGAANAMLVRNCSIKPLELSYEERNIVRGFFGSFDALPTMRKVKISFEVEYQSSGTAGTAPAYGPLLQACATTETLVAVTTATYAPNSLAATQKSVTIYYNIDGVQHMMLYGRGNATIRVKANGIPYIAFEFIGLDGGQTDVALPTPTFTVGKPRWWPTRPTRPPSACTAPVASRSKSSSSISATRWSRSPASATKPSSRPAALPAARSRSR